MTDSTLDASGKEIPLTDDGSLLPNATDTTGDTKAAADKAAADKAAADKKGGAADPEWFYADGVKGTGKPPEYYNSGKYKTLADQAQAQRELEKRFGAFTGAPKDGKYEVKMPEGISGEWAKDDPLFTEFSKWAGENQLSNDAFNQVLGMYALATTVDPAEIKKQIGENADQRLMAVSRWAKANLDEAGVKAMRAAVSGPTAAAAFQAIEAIIGKTRAGGLKVGDGDGSAGGVNELEAIKADQLKKNDKGQRLYEVDPKYRAAIEARLKAHYDKAA